MPPPGCATDAYKLFVGNVPKAYTEEVGEIPSILVYVEARRAGHSASGGAQCIASSPATSARGGSSWVSPETV